jgi:excisionase family DNA binding protein
MPEEMRMERLLTTEDVAELLRLDPVTVRRLVARGELSAYRIAGEYRFTPMGVREFVESQRVEVEGPNQPKSRFTERTSRVLWLAHEEARRDWEDGVGTEHLLLALLSEGKGVAALALSDLGVQLETVRAQVAARRPTATRRASKRSGGEIVMTPEAKASIELAVQEARALGHHYVGTEHLLLGLLREDEGLGGVVLREAGVTLEQARAVVTRLLAAGKTAEQPAGGAGAKSAPDEPERS